VRVAYRGLKRVEWECGQKKGKRLSFCLHVPSGTHPPSPHLGTGHANAHPGPTYCAACSQRGRSSQDRHGRARDGQKGQAARADAAEGGALVGG